MIVHHLIKTLKYFTHDKDVCCNLKKLLPYIPKFEVRCQPYEDQSIIDYAMVLIEARLLALPFERCYFEFPNSKLTGEDGEVTFSAYTEQRQNHISVAHFVRFSDGTFSGPFISFIVMEGARWGICADTSLSTEQQRAAMWGASMVAAAVAFMDIKETKREDVTVKPRVNKHRIEQGKQPLYDHTILTINKAARDALRINGESELIARRAHWRRGHLRHLPGKIVPVAPCLVRGEGFVSKEYRV